MLHGCRSHSVEVSRLSLTLVLRPEVVGSRAPLCVCCFWLPPFITICQSTLDAVTVAERWLSQRSVPEDQKHYYVPEKEGVLTNPRAEGRQLGAS